ncbi:hypothetical protein [Mesorhizobium sp.]|uniref:hypothetical protein n=1 Tax=Mesorhizobium sp. TaxID=1871066 RepID=UPI000FE58648|nr:MAG: hypothetical protein EOS09_34830 [Mesorhizobium sp.]
MKGGLVSNWLHDNLRPGHDIEIEGPVGGFNFDDLPCEKPLFLSGGSGITPVKSMLRALTDRASGHDIRFIHCARTADDIVFRSELEALAARFSNIDVSFVCSQEGSAWQGPTGRIDGPMLLRLARRPSPAQVISLRPRALYANGSGLSRGDRHRVLAVSRGKFRGRGGQFHASAIGCRWPNARPLRPVWRGASLCARRDPARCGAQLSPLHHQIVQTVSWLHLAHSERAGRLCDLSNAVAVCQRTLLAKDSTGLKDWTLLESHSQV